MIYEQIQCKVFGILLCLNVLCKYGFVFTGTESSTFTKTAHRERRNLALLKIKVIIIRMGRGGIFGARWMGLSILMHNHF